LFHSHDGVWKCVTELITLRRNLSIPGWVSADSTVWLVMQQTSEIPSLSFACVWWMSGPWVVIGYALKPQPCRRRCLSSLNSYQILSQLLRIRFLFVFRIFFRWCHVIVKMLVGMFERWMSAPDRSQKFSDDRPGGREQVISQISDGR
jgi:hypothetical protein